MRDCDCQGVGHVPWCAIGKKEFRDDRDRLRSDLAAAHSEIERLKAGLQLARAYVASAACSPTFGGVAASMQREEAERQLKAIDALLKEPKP